MTFPMVCMHRVGLGLTNLTCGKILHFAIHDGLPTVWALSTNEMERVVSVVGNRDPLNVPEAGLRHIMTAVHESFVWHAFEVSPW